MLLAFVPCSAQSAARKQLTALRAVAPISIDGVLDEGPWLAAPVSNGFIQYEPRPNVPASKDTEVRVLFDDGAVYIGAHLLDPRVDSLMFRLWQRDDVDIGDWFDIVIDPYRSGRNGFEYLVSAANVQTDMIVAEDEEDVAWDAVWESAVGLTPTGWIVEVKIPFSAIRFPNTPVQTWGINFVRHVGRTREKSFWSPLDPLVEGFLAQCGECHGISDVRPPARLLLYPYASVYVEHYPFHLQGVSDWSRSFNGGMDVKYGLSDAYTLDMTLVPDFGQVVSDNVVLNLSPFEVQYNENRQFFTEGTELFQRGGLFYSRRVGGEPLLREAAYDSLDAGETVVEDPATSRLINATKISGRGRKGLGVGFFNAITSPTHATVRDSLGNEREVLTDPLTNYNVLVVDQLLRNNSEVSITNTNVLRDGRVYDANATALAFTANNRARTLKVGGLVAGTWKFDATEDQRPGHRAKLDVMKTGGNWNYGTLLLRTDRYFDPNDLGIFFLTNIQGAQPFVNYTNYAPKGPWQRWNVGLEGEYLRVIEPDHFHNLAVEVNTFLVTRNFFGMGGHVRAEPITTYDPFEPRAPGRLYEFPANVDVGAFLSSDYSKRLALDLEGSVRWFDEEQRRTAYINVEPRIRASERLLLVLSFYQEFKDHDVGWATFFNDDILFARRDQWTTESGIDASYLFNNRMGITAHARHYWGRAGYLSFHRLDADGRLRPTEYTGLDANGDPIHDIDFDAFNVDLLFTWNFAPGSQLTLGWKNIIQTGSTRISHDYLRDLENTLAAPQTNSLSLKVLYYLDVLRFRGRTP